ncbi:MAG TPA: hypothetical protein VFX77_10655 [Rubrobacter sp.]|nr:hypothetical protein [Rubrobacter sp.]
MLEVVEQQEQLFVFQMPDEGFVQRPVSRVLDPERLGDGRRREVGVLKGASGTNATPSAKAPGERPATSSASLLLPTPPGPVSVTRRTSSRRKSPVTDATSVSRPRSGVGGTGIARRGDSETVPRAAGPLADASNSANSTPSRPRASPSTCTV